MQSKTWSHTMKPRRCFIEYVIRLFFHTSMKSKQHLSIPYNLGLKIVNNKTIWYVTTLFSSHLFTGKLTKTSSCLPTKWRRRHRACILLCYHYWTQKHWPITEKQWRWKQTKLNYLNMMQTKYTIYSFLFKEWRDLHRMKKRFHRICDQDFDFIPRCKVQKISSFLK